MPGYTLSNLGITETFYGWFTKTNDIIAQLNSVSGQGVSSAGLSGDNLIITLIDGSTFDAGSAIGPTGDSVAGAAITNGELIFTLNSGTVINVGNVVGPTGTTGAIGPAGSTGHTGASGPAGEGVPTGGNVGYALVKASNTDRDTEWSDITSLSRSHPGQIGGFETGTGDLIFGIGISQDNLARDLYPRWSNNYYLSEVHTGPGVSQEGAKGLYSVALQMDGYTQGYDDGLTAGIKVLNFLESTRPFESNYFTRGSCTGETLDGPPGFYWNRMKYFPTTKLQPIYVANYCTVDKYLMYISGYTGGATATAGNLSKRRGTYGWFGMIPMQSFPVGTPSSESTNFDGFVNGSTCAYLFRPQGAALNSDGVGISVTDSNFDVDGISYGSWTGDYVREVTPGRTGPVALYPESNGELGLGSGFTLSPGWYYLASEIIPAAWFSVGSEIDPLKDDGITDQGLLGDDIIITHTNASTSQGSSDMFGLNGFELAPEGESTGVGAPFTPSAYLGIASLTQDMETIPTGLPPYLWYTQGLSGASAEGRFGSSGSDLFFVGHKGLHPLDTSVDTDGAITVRAQNAEQASAPRIAISIASSSSQLDSLRALVNPQAEAQESEKCIAFWDGHVDPLTKPGAAGGLNDPGYSGDWTGGLDGIPWTYALFGQTYSDGVSAGWTFESVRCPDGTCPEFLRPPAHGGTYGAVGSDTSDLPGNYNSFSLNPQGLTTDGITGSTAEGFIRIIGISGDIFYYGFGLNVAARGHGVSGATAAGCTGAITDPAEGGGYNKYYRFPANGPIAFSGDNNSLPVDGLGVNASISIFVNAQEELHQRWFGTVSGSEKNHLVYFTGTFGCSGDGGYPVYTGP